MTIIDSSMLPLDQIDLAIVAALERDGRLSNVELSALVGLSPSPCLRRVKRLEDAGVIRGYHADIHPDAVGRGLEVLCLVTMQTSTATVLDDFEAAASAVPELLECHRLFGDVDFLLRVGVADLGAYQRLYDETLSRLPGVARVQSTITMKVVKARFDDRTGRPHTRR
jgi:DNA-binding Lrp family transcriptional regulator